MVTDASVPGGRPVIVTAAIPVERAYPTFTVAGVVLATTSATCDAIAGV